MVWNPWKMFVKQFIFSKILGLLPVTLLKKPHSQVLFKEPDHRFQNIYFTERLSVAASKIHKFLTFLWNQYLKWNFYLALLCWKVMVELATNLHKICSKLTINTPERQCLYCKLFTHFTTSLVFLPLTLNMKLFAGQLSSFCEDMWEQRSLQIRGKLCNVCLCEKPAKELFVRKAVGQILQIYKILKVLHIFIYFG